VKNGLRSYEQIGQRSKIDEESTKKPCAVLPLSSNGSKKGRGYADFRAAFLLGLGAYERKARLCMVQRVHQLCTLGAMTMEVTNGTLRQP
jgi:hypothetical protein